MTRRALLMLLPTLTTVAASSHAFGVDHGNEGFASSQPTFTVPASSQGGGTSQTGGTGPIGGGGPACQSVVMGSGDAFSLNGDGDITVGDSVAGEFPAGIEGQVRAAIAASPVGQAIAVIITCPDGSGPGLVYSPVGVDGSPISVDDLWPGAYDQAVGRIPQPDISPLAPPVEQGTLVNAPLWLAVQPPAPVSARAEAGPVWAEVTATFGGLTWDMGVPGTDADVVYCDGPGEPWTGPAPDWSDPWSTPPCGYNYTLPSRSEFTGTGNDWYDVTVTAHWSLHLVGSDGRSVDLEAADVVFEFDYVVYELQTVGHPFGDQWRLT